MVPFAGWEMPIRYTGIVQEHRAVRKSVGLFDVSHMGEVRVRGPQALRAVQGLIPNDLDTIDDGQALYTVMCNERGGIVDDLLVYRLTAEDILICVNAANRRKDHTWMVEHNPCPEGAEFVDASDHWGQVAVQGPNAEKVLQKLTPIGLSACGPFSVTRGVVAGVEGCIVTRTGYTGEDGFEVFLPTSGAEALWNAIMEAGEPYGIVPVGLGARDTLRLEAGFCLYGNDITDDTSPWEAGLGWTVKMDKPVPFVGQEALRAQRREGIRRRLGGLLVQGRIARPGHAVYRGQDPVGEVTSGTRAPWLQTNIAMAYLRRPNARPGTELEVDIRGRRTPARVVRPRFYKREG